ncbi:MAG: sulfite exporter TauE/SafE family protein [Deltaproteobacteria bacterium]|nr:sulfite exporter TauE/SafE family protein [Deltaproteobacteria bacterium]
MAAPVSGHVSPEQLSIVTDMLASGQWKYWGMALLGFMGGTLSGFIGSGGAFLMTPGMMNLGVPGVMAVGANITHKFGKAMMGSRKHGEYGHVDKKLAIFLLITALIGIKLAVWVNGYIFHVLGKAGSSLYVSVFFVVTLTLIGGSMLKDALRSMKDTAAGPSKALLALSSKLKFPPMINFPVSGVQISLWTMVVIGTAIGYMAGTIGVGGFIGVPAMIYVFGVPTVVAAGSELFLAMFMGAWGAFNYALGGFVDLRLTLLLYAGSLVGIYVGAIGTALVKELYIRLITALLILLCCISRALAVPEYLKTLKYIELSEAAAKWCEIGSKIFLFGSGIIATALIIYFTFRAHFQKERLTKQYQIPAARAGEA